MTKDDLTRTIVQLATEMRDVIKASGHPAQVVVLLAIEPQIVLASSAGADTGPILMTALKTVARRDAANMPPDEPVVLQ
jgi:hypothetical protein